MDRLSSAFTHLRARSNSSTGGTQRPIADEWFIPYTGQQAHAPLDREASIGTPPALSATARVKSSSHGNLLSVVCGGTMEDDKWEPGGMGRDKAGGEARNPGVGVQRLLPKRGNGGASASPSYEVRPEAPRETERFPSFTSVPTGLAADNILFSPLNRRMRAAASVEKSGPVHPFPAAPAEPRQRTVSAPHPRHHQHHPLRYPRDREERDDSKQWHPASMRELLVVPRPHLLSYTPITRTTHLTASSSLNSFATATTTDDEERVVLDGQARAREREEWAEYVRRRGRSLSLGGQAEPPLGALPVGNAKARERERSRSRERSRNSSSLSFGVLQGRKRSASFGSRWSHGHSRGSLSLSLSRGGVPSNKEKEKEEKREVTRGSFFGMGRREAEVPGSVGNGGGRREVMRTRGYGASESNLHDLSKRQSMSSIGGKVYDRGQTRSNPDLLNLYSSLGEGSGGSNSDSRYPVKLVGIPPTRTLQFKQPSVADRSGVVVITRGSARRAATLGSSARPFAPLDLSKPLPALPPEATVTPLPEPGFFPSLADEIGLAISPGLRGSGDFADAQSPAQAGHGTTSLSPVMRGEESEPDQENALRDGPSSSLMSEKRLSQLSDGGGATGGSVNARAFLAKQQQRAKMRRAFQSPVKSPVGYRHASDHASPLTTSTPSSSANTSFPAADDSSCLLSPSLPLTPTRGADGPRRKTAMEEAVGRNRAASVGILDIQDKNAQERARSALMERPKSDTPSAPIAATMSLGPRSSQASISGGGAGAVSSKGRPGIRNSAMSASVSMADWRASATPSIVADERDFNGLFFRTPHEAPPSAADSHHHAMPRVSVPPGHPVKAAYGMGYTMRPQQAILQPDLQPDLEPEARSPSTSAPRAASELEKEDKALTVLTEDQIRHSTDGSDVATVVEIMTPDILVNHASNANMLMLREGPGMSPGAWIRAGLGEVVPDRDVVMGLGMEMENGLGMGMGVAAGQGQGQRLMTPFMINNPIDSGDERRKREEALASSDEVPPSSQEPLRPQAEHNISPSPALPESTTMGHAVPSPIAFPRNRGEHPPSHKPQTYLAPRSLSYAHPRTPSRPTRNSLVSSPYRDFSSSPGRGGYTQDSAAVSFVDDFPSPPTRFTEEGDGLMEGEREKRSVRLVRSFGERF